mmetsp:Transcript_26722/g.60850  ORF Transcript_26722/g.60850 Transcript_26722/m.60850 type:complete len:93 (-) Transcript_26722:44-322(-)
MQQAFQTAPLPASAMLKPLIAFFGICLIDEVRKLICRTLEAKGMCGFDEPESDDSDSSQSGSDYESDTREDGAKSGSEESDEPDRPKKPLLR